tara:strand:+ start:133 stop:348 length:216 start_codon:yes stop_codon:yes gene_type:complete
MTKKIQINNTVRDMTPEEEAQRDSDEEQATIDKQAKIDAQTALEANKASGKAKLKTGEALNDAEVSALFGD